MINKDNDKRYWTRWYGWVIGLLVAEIIYFALFTKYFS
jgi:hypothetical protein